MNARRAPPAGLTRRAVFQLAAAAPAGLALSPLVAAQDAPVRVGYAIARSGPFASGAQITQEPNYLLWAAQQNATGGLNVKGIKRQVELVGSDDRNDIETCLRSYEKLMGSDKVDLILAPWGTNANFAIAPLASRFGYPLLAPTVLSRKLIDLKLPYYFSLLQQAESMMGALVDMLKAHGVKTAVVIYVDDLFGLESHAALRSAVQGSGISLLEEKSYPLGVRDLAPVLRAMKNRAPDAFIGLTYPPDTLLAGKQCKEIGFNPRFFYTGVGTAYPVYREVMGPGAEGVLGMGSWNSKTSPAAKAYFDAHVKFAGKEPDRWASGACWAGLEILTAAVLQVGLDRKAIRDYVAGTEHDTILGKMKFIGSESVGIAGTVSQWQKGELEVVWPKAKATAPLMAAKPSWV
jgi:branched-chain amino acid transport system substrate-binding protein